MTAAAAFLRRALQGIFVLGAVVLFFLSYNTFLLDHSLEALKFSLQRVAGSDTVVGVEGLGTLLDFNVVRELSSERPDAESFFNLEYSRSVLETSKPLRETEDLRFLLSDLVRRKMGLRGVVLNGLDLVVGAALDFGSGLPQWILSLGRKAPSGTEFDAQRYAAARDLERGGKLAEAIGLYEDLLKRFPDYRHISGVKLRAAYAYQRTGQVERAGALYKTLARGHAWEPEGKIAQKLLAFIEQAQAVRKRAAKLEERVKTEAVSAEEVQKAYLELGLASMRAFDFEQGFGALEKAAQADPNSLLAAKAVFLSGWFSKSQAKFEEAAAKFDALIQKYPKTEWVAGSEYEQADLLRLKGEFAKSAERVEALVDKNLDKPFAAALQFQAGSTYLYDAKDYEAAVAAFRKLKERYGESRYATKGLAVLKDLGGVEKTVQRQTEPVVLSWVEKSSPDVLARFAQGVKAIAADWVSAGGAEVSFSAEELRNVVQDRFAGIVPPEVQEFRFAIREEGVQVEGTIKLRKLALRFFALVVPAMREGRLELSVARFEIASLPIPEVLVEPSLEQVNLALEQDNFPVRIERLQLSQDKLAVKARPAAPSPPSS